MSLEFTINKELFKTIVDAANLVVDEARLIVSDKGVAITAKDYNSVMLVVAKISRADCEQLKFDGKEKAMLGIPLEKLKTASKHIKTDMISFSSSGEEATLSGGNVKYTFPLLNPELISKPPKIPDLKDKLSATVKMPGSCFKRMIVLSSKISDIVTFKAESGVFTAVAEGDIDRVEYTYDEDVSGEARARYSLEYLSMPLKVIKNRDTVSLKFGTNIPILVELKYSDSGVWFFIAPIVSEQEE